MASIHDEKFAARFTELWNSGLSTSKIGAQMGVSKNVICGLRKRLDLKTRGSPLRAKRLPGEASRLPSLPAPPRKPQRGPEHRGVQQDWLQWFNGLALDQRRMVAAASHKLDCPLIEGEGMWRCSCGVSLPGTPVLNPQAAAPEVSRQPDTLPVQPRPTLIIVEPTLPPIASLVLSEIWPLTETKPVFQSRFGPCQWPKGTPGQADFRYCDKPRFSYRVSYCQECAENAYVSDKKSRIRAQNREMAEAAD